jgi:hypothetical protein
MLPLAGCIKDFWQTTTAACTTNCTPVSSGAFYVLNSNAGQVGIAGYTIVSGTLTPLTGSPYTLPSGPRAIAVAHNNSFLYVSTQSGIFFYTIGAGGALNLASKTPTFSDFAAYSMQVDATDSWLVEASGSGYLYAIPISPTTGLTTGNAQLISVAGIAPRQLTISPDNSNIFVTLGASGTEVIPFAASSANPLPASLGPPIAVKSPGGAAISVAVDPLNQLLFIGETSALSGTNNGMLRAFLYSSLSSTPTEITGSPYLSGGLTPVSILPTASDAYVYVANATVSNSSAGNIAGFAVTVTGTTYSLIALSSGSVSAGTSPAGLAEDSTGSVVLLVNSGGTPDLDVYSFDTTTAGKLDSELTAATGTDPVGALAIAAAP